MKNEIIISEFAESNNIIFGICNAERLGFIEEYLQNTETPFVPKDVERRINPKLIMKDAQSIIVVGVSYNKKIDIEHDDELRGDFCIGAMGEDYHITVKNILNRLANKLNLNISDEQNGQYKGKVFSDNGDLIERELAKKAGIGVLGRNCSIISKKFGSMFNIGYIVTNMKLEVSESIEPFQLGCYNCHKCVASCPSSALSSETVKCDYEKCVSYTTQKKGALSDEEITNMGTKIYGCDICQDVCPHNIGVSYTTITDINMVKPELTELLTLTKKEFIEKYKKTSCGWRGKKLFKRNALIALSRIGSERSLQVLNDYADDQDEDIKVLVQRLLQRYKEI